MAQLKCDSSCGQGTPPDCEPEKLEPPHVEPCAHCGVEAAVERANSGRCWVAGIAHKPGCIWLTWIGPAIQTILERGFEAWNSRAPVVAPQETVYADGYCARCSELAYPLTRALEATGVPTGADNWQQTYGPNKVRALADFESELRRLLLALETGTPEDIKSRVEWANHRIEFHAAVRRRLTALAQGREPEPEPASSPSSPVPPEQEQSPWSEAASIVQACLNVHSAYSDAEREFASHLIEVFNTRDRHPDYKHRNTVRAYPAATPTPVEQERIISEVSVNSEEVKAIKARAYSVPQLGAEAYMFDVRQMLRIHRTCCAELHDALALIRTLERQLNFEQMASRGATDYTLELEQRLDATPSPSLAARGAAEEGKTEVERTIDQWRSQLTEASTVSDEDAEDLTLRMLALVGSTADSVGEEGK